MSESSHVPCRQQQYNLLWNILKQSYCPLSGIYVYGHESTGKSLVISSVLQHLQIQFVRVNCVECSTPRLIYEHIVRSLTNSQLNEANGYQSRRCLNTNDFVRFLKDFLSDDQRLVLVFEKVERLRDMDVHLLPALLRLREIACRNVSVILESTIIWEKFRTGTGCMEPFIVFFAQYSQEETMDILMTDCPSGVASDFYRSYVGLILSVFYHVCRNLCELRHLAVAHFTKYVEPVKRGEVSEDNVVRLLKLLEPELKRSMHTIYQHINCRATAPAGSAAAAGSLAAAAAGLVAGSSGSGQAEEEVQLATASPAAALGSRHAAAGTPVAVGGTSTGGGVCGGVIDSRQQQVELPYFSKFLLIAAYIASYNPSKTDRRFFVKHTGKSSKRSRTLAKKQQDERKSAHLLGPKQFAVDRLMAIFYSIIEDKVAPSAHLFTQICTLSTLGLLSSVSSTDQLDTPRYKCLASLDTVKAISKTVGFDVTRYLYDFL